MMCGTHFCVAVFTALRSVYNRNSAGAGGSTSSLCKICWRSGNGRKSFFGLAWWYRWLMHISIDPAELCASSNWIPSNMSPDLFWIVSKLSCLGGANVMLSFCYPLHVAVGGVVFGLTRECLATVFSIYFHSNSVGLHGPNYRSMHFLCGFD